MNVKPEKLRIGTRGSKLALRQAEMVRRALAAKQPGLEIELVTIKTAGDWRPEQGETRLMSAKGSKGQFVKALEEALLAGEIDAAVHSVKDMETALPAGLTVRHMLARDDPRDALLVSQALRGRIKTLEDLPPGAKIGTASVRRQAFTLNRRPDLKVVPLRGNVETRIQKVRAGQVDATFLACAGLNRLGLDHEIDAVIPLRDMLPACGQGAIGIEIKENNINALAVFDQINHTPTFLCVSAERAVLAVLDGSCHTPIGAYAVIDNDILHLRACVAALDGSEIYYEELEEKVTARKQAEQGGRKLGRRLKQAVPPALLGQIIDEKQGSS